jgi:hypothetical protein
MTCPVQDSMSKRNNDKKGRYVVTGVRPRELRELGAQVGDDSPDRSGGGFLVLGGQALSGSSRPT